MSTRIGVVGRIKADNVVTAAGEVGLAVPGGNGLHAAAGVRLWNAGCDLVGEAPENLPSEWLPRLATAGIRTEGLFPLVGFRPDANEWCFFRPDGNRRCSLFASSARLAAWGYDFPEAAEVRLSLSPEECARLEQAVASVHAQTGTPAPRDEIRLTPESVLRRLQGVQAVHLAPTLYAFQYAIAESLARRGVIVSLDPGHYMQGLAETALAELLRHVEVFAPSELEVREMYGECEPERMAPQFAAMGPRLVVIKLGDRGAWAYSALHKQGRHIPAYPARNVDPLGCGDHFCGGLLAGFLETKDGFQAARYGTVAASFKVEGLGAMATFALSRSEAERRLSELVRRAT